jgi:hypothetical protein
MGRLNAHQIVDDIAGAIRIPCAQETLQAEQVVSAGDQRALGSFIA